MLFHGEGWRRKTQIHPAHVSMPLYLEENFSARRGGFFARIPTRFPLLLYGESVVDVGIGCGYDMFKYEGIGVKKKKVRKNVE